MNCKVTMVSIRSGMYLILGHSYKLKLSREVVLHSCRL